MSKIGKFANSRHSKKVTKATAQTEACTWHGQPAVSASAYSASPLGSYERTSAKTSQVGRHLSCILAFKIFWQNSSRSTSKQTCWTTYLTLWIKHDLTIRRRQWGLGHCNRCQVPGFAWRNITNIKLTWTELSWIEFVKWQSAITSASQIRPPQALKFRDQKSLATQCKHILGSRSFLSLWVFAAVTYRRHCWLFQSCTWLCGRVRFVLALGGAWNGLWHMSGNEKQTGQRRRFGGALKPTHST